MRYLVLYEKKNGDMLYKYRNSKPQYEVGSYTSMGWKLLDVKRLSSGKAYSINAYSTLINQRIRVEEFFRNINYHKIGEFILFFVLVKFYM